MIANISGSWSAVLLGGKTVYTSGNVVVDGPVRLTGGPATTLTITNGAVVEGLTSESLAWNLPWPRLNVQSGGTLVDSHPITVITTLSAGGSAYNNIFENSSETVLSGATLGPPNTRTGAGTNGRNGDIRVNSGGTVDGMTFGNGVTLTAQSGANVINSTVGSGGSLVVSRGAGVSQLLVQSGGNATISVPDSYPAPQFDNLVLASGGNVTISGGAGTSDPKVPWTSPTATYLSGVWSAVLSNGVTVYTSGNVISIGPVHLSGGQGTKLYIKNGATVSGLSSELRSTASDWPEIHIMSGGVLTDSYATTVVTYISSGGATSNNLFGTTAEHVENGGIMGPGDVKQNAGVVFVSSGGTVDGLYTRAGSVVSAANGAFLNGTSTGSGATTSALPGAVVSFPTVMNGGTLRMTGAELFVCFLPGTLIDTADGPVAVECLEPGTQVLTICPATGLRRFAPMVWLGRQRVVANPALADDESGLPVRVRKDAFADGVPSQDLYVTSEHCFFFDGRFVPARMLVNGETIAYDRSRELYDCYHVELPAHSVILANNTETESYLDTGNRSLFDEVLRHPAIWQPAGKQAHRSWACDAAAPLEVSRAFVEPLHRRLAARASLPRQGGWAQDGCSSVPVILMTGEGERLAPMRGSATRAVFCVPAETRSVDIVSEVSRPCDRIGPFLDDRRHLGVLVSNVTLYGPVTTQRIESHLGDGALDGWWAQEGERCRWTDGSGRIHLPKVENNVPFILAIDMIDAYSGVGATEA